MFCLSSAFTAYEDYREIKLWSNQNVSILCLWVPLSSAVILLVLNDSAVYSIGVSFLGRLLLRSIWRLRCRRGGNFFFVFSACVFSRSRIDFAVYTRAHG